MIKYFKLDSLEFFCYTIIKLRKREITMELKECITCGSHSFTDNKCDYCGNVYKDTDDKETKLVYGNTWCDDGTESYAEKFNGLGIIETNFQEAPEGKRLLKVMIWTLISIIWFAVCVFIPPLFIITIFGLIILPVIKKLKK